MLPSRVSMSTDGRLGGVRRCSEPLQKHRQWDGVHFCLRTAPTMEEERYRRDHQSSVCRNEE